MAKSKQQEKESTYIRAFYEKAEGGYDQIMLTEISEQEKPAFQQLAKTTLGLRKK